MKPACHVHVSSSYANSTPDTNSHSKTNLSSETKTWLNVSYDSSTKFDPYT